MHVEASKFDSKSVLQLHVDGRHFALISARQAWCPWRLVLQISNPCIELSCCQ